MPSRNTHCTDLFVAAAAAAAGGVAMTPRSPNDKEYFPQDWLIDRLNAIGLPFDQQGRNSYPDFWVGSRQRQPVEGYEVKSLSFSKGKPARKDYDSNSTIPSGRKEGKDIFLVFFLYTGKGAQPRPVHSLCIAHTDFINCDHAVADGHVNVAIHEFGSYADGFIRNRKMYVFPHPLSLYPAGLGGCRLIVPASWNIADPRLIKIETLEREIAADTVRSYTIDLHNQGHVDVDKVAATDGGRVLRFDVFRVK